MRTKKIQAGIYEYEDSTGKNWLLQNRGYYFGYQTNMWSAYGEVKIVHEGKFSGWNAADLELSTTKKDLIKRIERRYLK